jgi:hypothetical protein
MADTWVVHRLDCKALPRKGGGEWHPKIMSNKWGIDEENKHRRRIGDTSDGLLGVGGAG